MPVKSKDGSSLSSKKQALAKTTTYQRKGFVFPQNAPLAGEFTLNVLPDLPDLRDRIYEPSLRSLAPQNQLALPAGFSRNQGKSTACTGFALAHVVNALQLKSGRSNEPVSAMMLFQMARLNDEWEGTGYEGSSIRGALKGFARHGVCSDNLAPFDARVKALKSPWQPSVEQAKDARSTRLGAYYRLRPEINDYHAAINEVGAIYVSAIIHEGWKKPILGEGIAAVVSSNTHEPIGGHAFTIVGYDRDGFIILNSWGNKWGSKGLAHWSYQDWAASVLDAWVLQLSVSAPAAAGLVARQALLGKQPGLFKTTSGQNEDIKGHYINIDDGTLQQRDPFATPDMAETGRQIVNPSANGGKGYQHLVIYAHGGLNTLQDEADRIAKMRPVFKRHGIYNLHLMWGTDLLGEIFQQAGPVANARVGGILSDFSDRVIEVIASGIGGRIWRHIKEDAHHSFAKNTGFGGGIKGLSPVLDALLKAPNPPKIHIVAHSAGSILAGHLLSWLKASPYKALPVAGIHLMAPACTTDFLALHYAAVAKAGTPIRIYNLSEQLELDDIVGNEEFLVKYNKSLLYLVSNALDKDSKALAGMALYLARLPKWPSLQVEYATRGSPVSASLSHGGFDNDGVTFTTMISRMLGRAVKPPIADSEL
jgi:Papain family cysteine protease